MTAEVARDFGLNSLLRKQTRSFTKATKPLSAKSKSNTNAE